MESTLGLPFHPLYCEENVAMWLRHCDLVEPCGALFVINARAAVAIAAQRGDGLRRGPGRLVIWDYHVVGLSLGFAPQVWDANSALGAPRKLVDYVELSFPTTVPTIYAPRFRWVPKLSFLRDFGSDRRHMMAENGSWLAPPPPWPPFGAQHTLHRFLDTEDHSMGELWTREELVSFAMESALQTASR